MSLTLFNLPAFASKICPANQNKMISRSDEEKYEETSNHKSNQPELSGSVSYQDAAIQEEVGRNFSKKR